MYLEKHPEETNPILLKQFKEIDQSMMPNWMTWVAIGSLIILFGCTKHNDHQHFDDQEIATREDTRHNTWANKTNKGKYTGSKEKWAIESSNINWDIQKSTNNYSWSTNLSKIDPSITSLPVDTLVEKIENADSNELIAPYLQVLATKYRKNYDWMFTEKIIKNNTPEFVLNKTLTTKDTEIVFNDRNNLQKKYDQSQYNLVVKINNQNNK